MTAPACCAKVSGGARLGCRPGGAARGCAVGASAAPCFADFDPPGRTAPAGWGPRAALLPRPFRARGGGSRRPPARVTTGCGGRSPVRVLFPCLSVGGVRVFVGALGVELRLHRGGGWGGSAPGAVTSTGRRPGASEAGPAAGARFAAQLWSALGNFCPLPAGPIFCEFLGLPSSSHPGPQRPARGWGRGERRPEAGGPAPPPPPLPAQPRAQPPAPPPRSRFLRKLRP